MQFSGQKIHFLGKNGFLTPCLAPPSKVALELFVWGLISYLSMKKKIPALSGKKCQTNFSIFTPTFFTYFLKIYLARTVKTHISVYNYNIQLLYDTTLLNFLFQFGSFWAYAEPY